MIVVKLSKQLNIANRCGIKIGGVNKLVPNLGNKSKYVLHYKNLQLYLSLSCIYSSVDFNAGKRKNASNSFEKYFFKVMNNSTFSKAKKILRKRINVRLINNARGYIRYGNKLRFVSQKISSKNFVAIYEVKPVLTLDKSI